jgi:hypothetical protein
LFIGAGGNNASRGSRAIQHRLYLNDGKGIFSISGDAFPPNDANISVAVAYDFDSDGDEDLFVGGRSVPYAYGLLPRSAVFQNNGNGTFTDVTTTLNPALAKPGMVTGAAWADITGDGTKELIVVGEWMEPTIFFLSKQSPGKTKEHGFPWPQWLVAKPCRSRPEWRWKGGPGAGQYR